MKRFMTLSFFLLIALSLFGDSIIVRHSPIPGIPLQKANVRKAEQRFLKVTKQLIPYNQKPFQFFSFDLKQKGEIKFKKDSQSFKKIINKNEISKRNREIILGPESFESSVPPANWYQFVFPDNQSSNRWFQTTNGGHSGSYVAWMNYDVGNIQNCALSTPSMDLSGYTDCSVIFYLWQSTTWTDTLRVLATTDSAGTWYTMDKFVQTGYNFDLVTVDLSYFNDSSHVFVAFNYYSSPDQNSEGLDYITIEGTLSSSGPNLTPYTPSGWDGPIVASSVSGTNTNGPNLSADSTTYIDWAVVNNGTVDITDTFYTYLYSDNVVIGGWYVDTLQAGYYVSVQDFENVFAEGTHTVSIFTDSTNAITETNETDNRYSHDFSWASGGGTGYQGNAEYIIITPSSFVNAFQPLAWWKSKKGIPTSIVTTDSIYSNWSGYDNAEKIRNFIKEAKDSGAIYILLGGQADYENGEEYVARRNVYCMTTGLNYYIDEDTIPCDMYYANLDGTWDSDGDHIYGEMSDGVDLYADIYVGRAPVKNTSQISYFISKIMAYENNPNPGYTRKIYLPQGNLWTGNSGRGINDTIYAEIPTSWQRSKQYEDIQGITRNIVNDSMDSGFNLQHWVGHGNEYGVYYNGGMSPYYYYTDPSTNTNDSSKTSIVNSIACFTGALDEVPSGYGGDCLAERMINSNKNVCVATMMNTRYGWGYSSPEGALGPSAEITVAFYRNLFNTSAYHLGEVFANALDDIASAANSNSYWRWSVYEHMLFGDPEMPIWTDIPQNLTVAVSPDTVQQSIDNTVTVTVTDGAKASVSEALVTFAQDGFQVYERELTSSGGIATAIIHPLGAPDTIPDTIYVTVTKENFIPYETYILSVKGTAGIKQKTIINELLKIRTNRSTIDIQFSLNKTSNVKFDIIDISGRMIKRIDKQFAAGKNSLSISSKDMARGIYFLKIDSNDFNKTKKIAIIR